MWMLSFIPDSWLYLAVLGILASGIFLYVLTILANFWPPAKLYKGPLRVVALALIISGVYFYGSYATEASWRKRVADVQAQVDAAHIASDLTNRALVEERNKKQKVIREYAITVKEQIVEKEKIIDSECKVATEAITILNQAAKNPIKGLVAVEVNDGDKK
jgi:hypothetical protein